MSLVRLQLTPSNGCWSNSIGQKVLEDYTECVSPLSAMTVGRDGRDYSLRGERELPGSQKGFKTLFRDVVLVLDTDMLTIFNDPADSSPMYCYCRQAAGRVRSNTSRDLGYHSHPFSRFLPFLKLGLL